MFMCIVICYNFNFIYAKTVPHITITMWPSDPIQGAMVGSPQDIQCIVSTVSGVELSSVMISWMGPEGESITNDSRVTISPTTSSGNNYNSSLQFTYLKEGDEGMYTCNVMILETGNSNFVTINNLTSKYFICYVYYCMNVKNSILLKPHFKGFCWGISNICITTNSVLGSLTGHKGSFL